jgi:Uma2 family endonuclease
MAVMHVPAESGTARPEGLPPGTSTEDLWNQRDQMDLGHRQAEVLDGRIIVSPVPRVWHQRACKWLERQLQEIEDTRNWFIDRHGEIELPATGDLIEPDLMVLTDSDALPDEETRRPLDKVLLVTEVVSKSSIRDDRELKPRACALSGVPLYLLIDRFTEPLSVTLLSQPGPDGYITSTTVRQGNKLALPEPFGITLDTATLPLPQ